MLNSVALIGRLTRDPEKLQTNGGKSIAKFTLASDEGYGDKKKALFIDVTAWDKTADNVCQYCSKGSQVAISGKLRMETWTDKQGGNRSKISINANDVHFIGTKKENPMNETEKENTKSYDDAMPF